MRIPVYFDYAATTPVDPRVAEKMIPLLSERYGNAASRTHAYGWDAERAVEEARAQVAALINCDPKELVFTSGATEAINLALKGGAHEHRERGRHLVTVRTEHKATLDSAHELERQGYAVTYLGVDAGGLVDLKEFAAALRADTILASVMAVNNEIGVVQDIAAMGEICHEHGVLFHVDAAQATGKIPLDLAALQIDLMSLSAHKTYGPKGVGALYLRRKPRVQIEAQVHGGGQERGLRAGTLATHQIVGMGEAFRLARLEMAADNERIAKLRDRLWNGLAGLGEVYRNGDCAHSVPHHLNLSFAGVGGESLMLAIRDLAVSSGSACSSASLEPSHVLRALGRDDELAHSSIRLTLGRFTTAEEVDYAIESLARTVTDLRGAARQVGKVGIAGDIAVDDSAPALAQ